MPSTSIGLPSASVPVTFAQSARARRELLAGNGKATLEVFFRVGHRLGDFGRLEYRVHDDAATTLAAAVVTGAVVDEDSE
ncbi:hypothetical protein G9444_1642 [Rhodococcus erythropolis]|uniref:Uncharacterized protein n=1 Tax=Rhodococcus erythropolis TaxID=1833 RepID=A0A6G9CQ93_RHOER|nr:hypothetical protein G9444_1642 [Rhodococcus erythropolis]